MLLPPGVTGNTSNSAGILSSDKGASNNVMANGVSCWLPSIGVVDCCCGDSEYPGVSNKLLKALVLATPPDVLLLVGSKFAEVF